MNKVSLWLDKMYSIKLKAMCHPFPLVVILHKNASQYSVSWGLPCFSRLWSSIPQSALYSPCDWGVKPTGTIPSGFVSLVMVNYGDNDLVPRKYFNACFTFSQLHQLDCFTYVHRNVTKLLAINMKCATVWWNYGAFCSLLLSMMLLLWFVSTQLEQLFWMWG